MTPRLAVCIILGCGFLGMSGCARSKGSAATPPPSLRAERPVAKPAVAPVAKAKAKPAPSEPKPVAKLEVRPASVTLAPGDLGAQMIVEGPGTHSGRRDWTSEVRWEVEPKGVVAVSPSGYLHPIAPGQAKLRAVRGEGQGTSQEVPITVTAEAERPWDFAEDIVPIFTHAGCNAGGCHGKADGQNGFHLSLFGYDAEGDYRSLSRDSGGRRLTVFRPDDSLLLQKATGRVPHVGGQRIAANSVEYRTLRDWIAAGAPYLRGKTHGALAKVVVEPSEVRLDEPGPQQLRVVAHYADGHQRDVTRLSTFRVNDETTATITPNGQARLLRRAETDLIIHYRTSVVSTRLATLINPDLSFDFASLPRNNFIDDELFKRLESLRVPPSPQASDTAFLRRASLDLTGEQPTPDQIRAFLADNDPDKRAKLIDRLLASADFTRFWEIKLGDMLQITSNRPALGPGAARYRVWLEKQLAANTPWDVLVRTLVTAKGDPNEGSVRDPRGGAVYYAISTLDPKEQAEQTAQRFLGLRLRCAQCHDHPFDVWTQDDYYGLAAIFAKVEFTGGMSPNGMMMGKPVVKINPKGAVEHPRTKKPATPKLLDGKLVPVPDDQDPRQALADWMTAPDNPYFARAMANWVWAQLFGKGIADPPDDLSRSNPPVHPELLDAIARHFVEHRYDLRDLIRTIATSRAYGLSSATVPGNEHDTRLFSHHLPRPLTAHQMADALAQATDVPNSFQNRPRGTRAIEIFDPAVPSMILDTFGRCTRTAGCASVGTPALSLRQALLLIGGYAIEDKVTNLHGYLASLLELNPEPEEIVENLYLRTVCRPPTEEELSRWTHELKTAASLREATEDLFWALLNSREFAFNH
jgi:hypothetical protein